MTDRRDTSSIKWNPELIKKWCGKCYPDTLSYWVADMDFKSPPAVSEALLNIVNEGVYGYSDFTDDYYQAVIGWYNRRYGVDVRKEWICYSNGIVPTINYIIQNFTNTGDGVIIQQPVYYPFSQAIENNNRNILSNELIYDGESYSIDFEDLEKLAKRDDAKLMVLCSPHNPVGRVWSEDEILRILEICKRYDVLLISDEIHSDIVYGENVHNCILKYPQYYSNVFLASSPTKTFNIAGIQVANIIIPDNGLREKFKKALMKYNVLLPNIFAGAATIAAYTKCDSWLSQLLSYLEGNIDAMKKFLSDAMPQVKLVEPQGTTLAWIDMKNRENYKERALKLTDKAHVAIDNGYIFGSCGESFERINFATERGVLLQGLRRIADNL